jgi:hypothetical protein
MRPPFTTIALLVSVVKAATLDHVDTLAFSASGSNLQLGGVGLAPTIRLDSNDWPGVIQAAGDVALDFGRVLGTNGTVLLTNSTSSSSNPAVIIAGTIGKSTLIDTLVSSSKIDVSAIKGKWESYTSQVVSQPVSGVSSALVIAGSDKRGTIYGLYDISEQIGVSPWYWWADVPPKTKTGIWALPVKKVQGPPSVQYRGIFLNDEAPALSNWVKANYPNGAYGAGYNSNFYSKVFELLLRLRANYLWPAMWDNMFYADDSASGPLADMYGIVMGTSHTEPMARATKEQHLWLSGTAGWDWLTNQDNVKSFMVYGANRAKTWETLWTMGMRGDHDTENPNLNGGVMQEIISFQQSTLKSTLVVSSLTNVPQTWCLYKVRTSYLFPENIELTLSTLGGRRILPSRNDCTQ